MARSGYAIQHEVTITVMTCPVCGVLYGLTEDFRARAQEDGDKSWYCPAGHSLSYSGVAQKRKEEMERNLANAQERMRMAEAEARIIAEERDRERRSHAHTKGELTKTKKKVARAEKGVCTVCNRSFFDVAAHMETKHGTSEERSAAGARQRHDRVE